MKPMELSHLRTTLREECQLAPDRLVVVGVSGGPDSLCLLDALQRVGLPVLAAHFDHGLRPESSEDSHKVAELARQIGVPLVVARQDVREYASQARLSIEEAARTARYRFLFEQARLHQAQAVAVAHTADDQVETVLMHLLRGAGLDGLKGMAARVVLPEWDPQLPLVRPLLATWRAETEGWCLAHSLTAVMDASNLDTRFFRNRLRHELIPNLQTYNPQVKEILWRTARTLAGDAEVVGAVLKLAWQDCRLPAENGWVVLDCARLAAQPLGLRRAVLRRAIRELNPALRDIDFGAVERGLALLSQPGSRRAELTAGLGVVRAGDRLWVGSGELPAETELPQTASEEIRLEIPGEVHLKNGWVIAGEWEAQGGHPWMTTGPEVEPHGMQPVPGWVQEAWLDGDRALLPFVICPALPGQRFAPIGMGGHTLKLSDFFTNQKVPLRARGCWPLLLANDEVVWVAGLRLAEGYKVTAHTNRVIHLSLRRPVGNARF